MKSFMDCTPGPTLGSYNRSTAILLKDWGTFCRTGGLSNFLLQPRAENTHWNDQVKAEILTEMIKHILSFAEDGGRKDRDMILVWENLSDWLLIESGTTWSSWNWGATWRESYLTQVSRCECFLELSDSLQFKPGGSCFPSLISWTSGLSVCLTDSYLQNFFCHGLDPDELQCSRRESILNSCPTETPGTQSTWSSCSRHMTAGIWECRDQKCKSMLGCCYVTKSWRWGSAIGLSPLWVEIWVGEEKNYVVSNKASRLAKFWRAWGKKGAYLR